MRILAACACLVALVSGCNVAPYTWHDDGKRVEVHAIDATRISVREEFRYAPTLTSYVLPAGEYLPIRADAGGTFYESPRGVLVQSAAGGFVVNGGILRRKDPKANYPFALYLNMPGASWTFVDLHSLRGLNLNDKIVCNPPAVFK